MAILRGWAAIHPIPHKFQCLQVTPTYGLRELGMFLLLFPSTVMLLLLTLHKDVPSCLAVEGIKGEKQSRTVKICPFF